jgi:hypothetical protein
MRITKLFYGLLTAGLLGLVACSKSSSGSSAPLEINGVKVDQPSFVAAFENAPPEVKGSDYSEVTEGIRYRQWDRALVALDKLGQQPNLNEAQKKSVAQLTEQLKQVVVKGPPATSQ